MGVCSNLEEESLPLVLSLDVALSLGVVTIEWEIVESPSQYLKPLLGGDETHLHRALMTRIVASVKHCSF